MPQAPLIIPSMTGGVSQQPAALRLPTQCKSEKNAVNHVTRGWEKRPPTEHVAALADPTSLQGDQLVHFIDRDDDEKYVVVIGDETLKVFDLEGTEMTLLDNGGVAATQGVGGDFAYLSAPEPSKDFKAITIADYTFVLNRTKTASLKAATTNDRDPEGIISIKQGSYATRYKVTLSWNDGAAKTCTVEFTSHYSSGKDALLGAGSIEAAEDSIRTEFIADEIHSALIGSANPPHTTRSGDALHADFTTQQKGSTIWIKVDPDGGGGISDFAIEVDDDVASSNMEAFKDTVEGLSRLPLYCRDKFEIAVAKDPEEDTGGYYVRFDVDDGSNNGDGHWTETVKQGIQDTLLEGSMPHLLVRGTTADTFIWAPADGSVVDGVTLPTWGKRTVGDTDTNKDPEFVGKKISDIVLFRNRTALLAGDSVSLSEDGGAFNFFRASVIQVLDSDRISTTVGDRKVVTLRHGVPVEKQLLMFADKSQHILSGSDDTLTPKTAYVTSTTHFETDDRPTPAAVGSSVFSAENTGSSSLIREMIDVSTNRPKFADAEITAHVPTYIKGRVLSIDASATEKVVIVRSDDDLRKVFVYRFFQNGDDRIQSAWNEWVFSGEVKGVAFFDSVLYMLVEHMSDVTIETMNLELGASDSGKDYLFSLDRRIRDTDLTSVVYNSVTDKTTLTLPYNTDDPSRGFMAVYDRGNDGRFDVPVQLGGVNLLQVTGDVTGKQLWIGEFFVAERDLGELHLQTPSGQSGSIPVMRAKMRLKVGEFVVEDTGYLDVEVSGPGRAKAVVKYRGAPLGGGFLVGKVVPDDARLTVTVMGRAGDTVLKLLNGSPFPSRVLSASFDVETLPSRSGRDRRRRG